MPISNPNPITVPESYARTFDQFFLTKINFEIKNLQEACGFVVLKPYDYINDETLDKPITLPITDLWNIAEEVPEIKAAMDAVQSGVEAYQIYLNNKAQEARELAQKQMESNSLNFHLNNPPPFLPNS